MNVTNIAQENEDHMSKRKIICKNNSCKFYDTGDRCRKDHIEIGGSGTCQSFRKGLPYYFHLVWDALSNKNYIDAVELMQDSDLKIGMYYVMKCYHLAFVERTFGNCRLFTLIDENDDTKASGLNADKILKRDLDMEELQKHLTDFNAGILPTSKRKDEPKVETDIPSGEYGWLAPDGRFTPSPFGTHEETAEKICDKYQFTMDYWRWEQKRSELGLSNQPTLRRDYLLMVKNYCLIHDPAGGMGYIVTHRMPLTEKQKNFLFYYFKNMGDVLRAEHYASD